MTLVSLASQAAGPALNGLANLTRALKEPIGKKKLEEMRQELGTGLENISEVLATYDRALEAVKQDLVSQNACIERLEAEIEYLRLPFYRRWFTPFPGDVKSRSDDTK